MFTDLAGIRAQLKDRIAPHLDGVKIVDELKDPTDAVVPVLYFEYTEISSSANGQPLARDQVAAGISLVITAAGSADEDAVDAHILDLAHALQLFDDIYWDAATKVRLESGHLAWRVNVIVLSTIQPAEPDTPEE